MRQRKILWYLVFAGFSVNYMIRCNLNIAIIDMVDPSHLKKIGASKVVSECFDDAESLNENENVANSTQSHSRVSSFSFERYLLEFLSVSFYE